MAAVGAVAICCRAGRTPFRSVGSHCLSLTRCSAYWTSVVVPEVVIAVTHAALLTLMSMAFG